MNQYNLDKLQAEITVAGAQLLYNTQGRYATQEQMEALAQWARIQAPIIARRLQL